MPVESAIHTSKLVLAHVDTASYTPRKAYRHAVRTSHNVGETGSCQQLSTIGRVARLLEPGSGSLGSINSGCEGISERRELLVGPQDVRSGRELAA